MDNIIENNKLIAKFMGFVADKSFEVKLVDGINTSCYYYKDDVMYLPEVMAYHSDWNWLMEVVEKIENLSKEGETYMFSITKFSARVTYKGSRIVDLPIDNTKIEAVYNACVEFIKWYNEQNKNNEKHLHISNR